jgi:hypothetical protein
VLELSFETSELRLICEDAAYAEATYGVVIAAALVARLADLLAASQPLELPFVSAESATTAGSERLIVDIAGQRSLVIVPNPQATPRNADGSVAWEHVHRLKILCLE